MNTALIKPLLAIRAKQTFRSLKEFGILPSVLLLAAISFAYYVAAHHPSIHENPEYWCLMQWFITFGTHTARNDVHFLKELQPKATALFLAEYAVLALPIAVLLFANGQILWGVAVLLSTLIAFAPHISWKASTAVVKFKWISPTAFEWHSGWRKQWPNVLLIGLAGIGLATVHFAAIPAALLLIGISFIVIYNEREPVEMLEAVGAPPTKLLFIKWKELLAEWGKLALPFLLAQGIFHPVWQEAFALPVLVGVWLSVLVSLSLALLIKYANYRPNSESKQSSVYANLALISFLIPFLAPIPFLFLFRSFRKAKRNLSDYLSE